MLSERGGLDKGRTHKPPTAYSSVFVFPQPARIKPERQHSSCKSDHLIVAFIICFSERDLERCRFIIRLCVMELLNLQVFTQHANREPVFGDIRLLNCYTNIVLLRSVLCFNFDSYKSIHPHLKKRNCHRKMLHTVLVNRSFYQKIVNFNPLIPVL